MSTALYGQTETAEVRARRGIALLDLCNPLWWQDVDPDRLDIDDPWVCVLGQAYGSYSEGYVRLDLGFAGTVQHGFAPTDPAGGDDVPEFELDARALETVWREAIWLRASASAAQHKGE